MEQGAEHGLGQGSGGPWDSETLESESTSSESSGASELALNPYPDLEGIRGDPQYSDSLYVKGVAYGFLRLRLDGTRTDHDWHCWTLFFQSSHNLDLSPIVSKVSFIIHEDFIHPTRSVTEPPYEITVLGKKSFTAFVEVFYRDPTVSPSFFSINISFQETERYKRVVKSDVLLFIRPRLEFARLLDIERPSPVLSGISHHLDGPGFVRRQNLRGVMPDFIDEEDVWRRPESHSRLRAHGQPLASGPAPPLLHNQARSCSAYFTHKSLESVYQYDCDELGGSVGVFETQTTRSGKGERRAESEDEFQQLLASPRRERGG